MNIAYIRNFLRDVRDQLNNECYRLHSHNNTLLGHVPSTPTSSSTDTPASREPNCFAEEYQQLVKEIQEKMGWLATETDRAVSITSEKETASAVSR